MSLADKMLTGLLPIVPKPIVKHFSKRYIAGETLQQALQTVRDLNDKGFCATLDILGENVATIEEATAATEAYHKVLKSIDQQKLDCSISVKLTHLGLKLDREFCFRNLHSLVEDAQNYGNFVRIDMEDSSCTSDTIDIFLRLREEFTNVGIAIQAYLRRSLEDVRRLMRVGANVRLCKGIYVEPRTIAYRDKDIINKNYVLLLEELLRNGNYVGIATHDEKLVWEAYRIIDQLHLEKSRYEFQMLLGVDEQLRQIILDAGHRLRVYVPFGEQWYNYSLRRLRENPQIAGYVLKSLFQRRL